jgi:hypothetical protein
MARPRFSRNTLSGLEPDDPQRWADVEVLARLPIRVPSRRSTCCPLGLPRLGCRASMPAVEATPVLVGIAGGLSRGERNAGVARARADPTGDPQNRPVSSRSAAVSKISRDFCKAGDALPILPRKGKRLVPTVCCPSFRRQCRRRQTRGRSPPNRLLSGSLRRRRTSSFLSDHSSDQGDHCGKSSCKSITRACPRRIRARASWASTGRSASLTFGPSTAGTCSWSSRPSPREASRGAVSRHKPFAYRLRASLTNP